MYVPLVRDTATTAVCASVPSEWVAHYWADGLWTLAFMRNRGPPITTLLYRFSSQICSFEWSSNEWCSQKKLTVGEDIVQQLDEAIVPAIEPSANKAEDSVACKITTARKEKKKQYKETRIKINSSSALERQASYTGSV